MKNFNDNKMIVLFFIALGAVSTLAVAESDMQLQEKALKAREMSHNPEMDHSQHQAKEESTSGFRGVFYGYLPCTEKGCSGLKMTLSLKQGNNYLLVSQPAKESSREFYEKGKYNWDDNAHTVTLTPNKAGEKRLFTIKDGVSLIQLNSNGGAMAGDQDDYTLRRSDAYNTRQVHIH